MLSFGQQVLRINAVEETESQPVIYHARVLMSGTIRNLIHQQTKDKRSQKINLSRTKWRGQPVACG